LRTVNDLYDSSDDENSVYEDKFANLKELGILDYSYDSPKESLDAAIILFFDRLSTNTLSGGLKV